MRLKKFSRGFLVLIVVLVGSAVIATSGQQGAFNSPVTAAGANGQLQYNNNGVFAGSTWTIVGGSALVGGSTSRLKVADQGQCTMASGACTVPIALGSTYSAAPNCHATWNGTGTLTGVVKLTSSTTQITALTSSVGTDTAVMNWICFGN